MVISLFIYTIYRPSDTIVNHLFQFLFDSDFEQIRIFMQDHLHFPNSFIYNLPEGLWVFSLTLAARNLYLNVRGFRFPLIFFPLCFALVLEVLQGLNITDGTFDVADISTSIVFWLFGYVTSKRIKQNTFLTKPTRFRLSLFSFLFACIYLSDVLPV